MVKQAVILAAGESSRFWPFNYEHKSLFKVMGKPLLFYLVRDLQREGLKEIIIVQGPSRDIEKALTPFAFQNLKYIFQEKPLGTGDALLKAEKSLKGPFLLMNAERIDAREYLKEILAKEGKGKAVILADTTKTPHLFGILKTRGEDLLDIIEKPKPEEAPSALRNIGFYLLPKEIFYFLKKVSPHPHSLIKAVVLYAKDPASKGIKVALTKRPALFLKFPWDLFRYEKYLFARFLEDKIASDAKIAKTAQIEGRVQIGSGVKIQEAQIQGPCYIGDNTVVGKNAVVGQYSNLEDNIFLGNLSEVKNSLLQKGVKGYRLALYHSIVGPHCSLGAGTVFASQRFDEKPVKAEVKGNRFSTGLKELGAMVGEGTKIGVNCSLMPGVMVGRNCIIGPHSLVKENIEDNKLFYVKLQNLQK